MTFFCVCLASKQNSCVETQSPLMSAAVSLLETAGCGLGQVTVVVTGCTWHVDLQGLAPPCRFLFILLFSLHGV